MAAHGTIERPDPRLRETAAREAAGMRLSREQRSKLPPFAALRAFEAVGALGGIRRAAAELAIDHAAISRHLRTLEQWTGTALVERGAGLGGRLTPQGQVYHRHVVRALADLANATSDLQFQGSDAHLRVWCMPGLASQWLVGRIGGFLSNHPELSLEVQPSEAFPDFDAQQADAHIHYMIDGQTPVLPDRLRSTLIARPRILAVATRAYLAATPQVRTPEDLLGHTLLHEADDGQWRRWMMHMGVEPPAELRGPRFWQGHLTLGAARRGQGIALANMLLVEEDLAEGRLVELGGAELGNWGPVHLGTYHFIARADGWRGRAIVDFRDWLVRSLAKAVPA
jgi:LysR family transcriptional regulator, glycine cleavage system transcriptional activator